jgi:hypothetical protein
MAVREEADSVCIERLDATASSISEQPAAASFPLSTLDLPQPR